jgi:hypothetical protein
MKATVIHFSVKLLARYSCARYSVGGGYCVLQYRRVLFFRAAIRMNLACGNTDPFLWKYGPFEAVNGRNRMPSSCGCRKTVRPRKPPIPKSI